MSFAPPHRGIGWALALVLGLLLTSLPAAIQWAPAVGAPGKGVERNQRGFDELNECLATNRRVDALYVMDVSGSLQQNDPDGRRFDALEASVVQLGVLASAGEDPIDVYAAASTFGDSYTGPKGVQDWTRIPAQRAASSVADTFRRSAETAWRDAGTAQGTNYEAALSGAHNALRARGSRADACQVVFWFTDGLFSLGDPYDVRATDAASDQMCRPGGLLDQLRADNVSVVALALKGPDVEAQLSQPEYAPRRGELEAMAVGGSGKKRCGTTPIPESSRSGIYLAAGDPTALGALFSGVAARASGCVPTVLRTTLPARVDVDPGVRKFQVDVSATGESGQVSVTGPGGQAVTAKVGSTAYLGGDIRVTRVGSLTTIAVTMPGAGKPGQWDIALGGNRQPSAVTLYRCSDLDIDIAEPGNAMRGGTPATLDAVVRDSSGAPADLSPYRGSTPESAPEIQATSDPASDITAEFTDLSTGKIRVTLTPPENTLSLDVGLAFTPRLADRARTELSPVTGSKVLSVTPPGSFPTMTPSHDLDLGATDGLTPARARINVRGPSEGTGKICFAPAEQIDAPAAAGTMRVATSLKCRNLDPGESLDVTVAATPTESSDGFGTATLPVTLSNADGDEIQQDVAVRWELQRQVDQGFRLGLLLLALLLALLLPLLALALVNRALARFAPGDVRHASYHVRVAEDGTLVPERPLSTTDLVSTYVQGADRRHVEGLGDSGIDLRAKAPLSPLGSPEFVAIAPPGTRLVAGDGDVRRRGKQADVTAGLGAIWLLTVDDDAVLRAEAERPEGDGTEENKATPATLTFVTRGEGQDHLEQLFIRCGTALADGRWTRVRSELERYAREDQPRRAAAPEARETEAAAAEFDDDPFGSADETGVTATGSDHPERARGRVGGRARRGGTRRPDSQPPPVDTDDYEDPFA